MERRRQTRYLLKVKAVFRWQSPAGGACEGSGWTRDVSVTGVFVECETPVPDQLPIALELSLPATTSANNIPRLQANGRVVRYDGTGFAAATSEFRLGTWAGLRSNSAAPS